MWALWVAVGVVVWLALAIGVGVVLGRGIRLADRREAAARQSPVTAPARTVPARAAVAARSAGPVGAPPVRRRPLPLPPIGIALAATAVVLESIGYVERLSGATGVLARTLSMDAPLSIPRMYVATLFTAAAAAALLAAATLPQRRTWWAAVGVVSGGIAAVKAGGTLHAAALGDLYRTLGAVPAQAISVLVAGAVVLSLLALSRGERRDRRVLGVLCLYAVAAVGLSGAGNLLAGAGASHTLLAACTFLEESGEALSAVGFLVAVLAGVAPRVVVPSDWPLRRAADAQTLEVPEFAGRRSDAF